jgi:hypothetical protein
MMVENLNNLNNLDLIKDLKNKLNALENKIIKIEQSELFNQKIKK